MDHLLALLVLIHLKYALFTFSLYFVPEYLSRLRLY